MEARLILFCNVRNRFIIMWRYDKVVLQYGSMKMLLLLRWIVFLSSNSVF